MKRNVYVLVDETKNEFIGCQIANSDEDMKIQLENAKQQHNFDVKISCYWLTEINLNDDNVFSRCPVDLDSDKIIAPKFWTSIATEVSKNVKSDVMEEEE